MGSKKNAAEKTAREGNEKDSVDRKAVVERHSVRLDSPDLRSPLSVGNGSFCFTADITGLQTFEEDYAKGLPLAAMADWGWHSFPNATGHALESTMLEVEGADGRAASYPINSRVPAYEWFRSNPHRLHLGRIGLVLIHSDGSRARLSDIEAVDQSLDLWSAEMISRFRFDSQPVIVRTCVLPDTDAVALRVESPLLRAGRLRIEVAFPYPSGDWGPGLCDWESPERHTTTQASHAPSRLVLHRQLDAVSYGCTILAENGVVRQCGSHECEVRAEGEPARVDVLVGFSETDPTEETHPEYEVHATASAVAMREFWMSGGAMDLSESSDPRWRELERRIVLSQYLTAIQSRGATCPQETGLTSSSWYGKFHLEMHWWHSVHFALWGRESILVRQLEWYVDRLPPMKAIARRQGYRGARWGKMLDPEGHESPSWISPLLIWQQPHPIYYAEQIYRIHRNHATLETYWNLVEQTAEFMADFAVWNDTRRCYELGPPFISAREFGWEAFRQNKNGSFELAYWRWGLETAILWQHRLGLPVTKRWREVASHLAPLPLKGGLYLEQEIVEVENGGHPAQLAAWGLLPRSECVNAAIMENTLDHVLQEWDFQETWGWDFPLIAMTAARLGRPETAVDALLLDVGKNAFLPNGHNYQTELLPCYLPGNGGLLAAAAMLAAGWGDCDPSTHGPGFGQGWSVAWEGLRPMI